MKKIVFILVLILFSSVVIAGNTYDLDFSKSDSYLVGMREGDRAEFNLNDEKHTIIVRDIRSEDIDITAFLNLNTQNSPYYTSIGEINGENMRLKLDTNKDNIDDLFVWLESSNGEKAGVRFLKPVDNRITGNGVIDTNQKPSYKWIIFPLMVVVLLILVIKLRKKRSV